VSSEQRTTNPSSHAIKDADAEVHNYLLGVAQGDAANRDALVLAAGLSAIHERLGDMWIWMKEWRA